MRKKIKRKIKLIIDYAFKRIFGDEKNKDILLQMVNDIVYPDKKNKLVEISLLNPFNLKNYAKDKLTILDIKARDNEGGIHDIEVQIIATSDYPKRILYYGSDLYRSQMKDKMKYSELNKVICIHFVDDVVLKDTDQYFNKFMMRNEEGVILTDDITIYLIELPKFNEDLDTFSIPASL